MMQPDVNVPAEKFTSLITELKKAHDGTSNLTRDDLKTLTAQVFGNIRESVENLIDLMGPNDDGINNRSPSRTGSVGSLDYISRDSALDALQQPPEEISNTACDIEEQTGQAASAPPQTASPQGGSGIHRALEALDSIASQLRGFYQWLKEKTKKIASDLWQAVRRAFSTMLAWVRTIWQDVQSCCSPLKASAKVHVS